VHVNAESGYAICDSNGCGTYLRASKYPYENAIEDVTHHLYVREREFAALDIPGNPQAPAASDTGDVLASGVKVEKLADGFFSIAGAAVDATGKLYFADRHQQRIYGWSAGEGLTVERDNALDPVNLGFDRAGDLIVVSSNGPEGTVYSFKPGRPDAQIEVLQARPAAPHGGASALLPANYWNNEEFEDQLNLESLTFTTLPELFSVDVTTPKAREYVSPDGSVFLPAGRVFQQGPPDYSGWRFSDNLDTYGLISAHAGERVYVSSSSEDRTYSGLFNPDGTLSDLRVFAERGGESVAVAPNGNIFIANGQIFVYNTAGKKIAEIDVPERPIDIVFGGQDRRLLFILAHHALYSVWLRE
jgi:hypothetical protein